MIKPLILVTNDDGVLAPGLRVLADAMAPLGEVLVCAPDTERSGASHSITLHSHLRVHPVQPGWWSVNGTPVDCVYLAALHLCSRVPALVVSGINPGFNLGSDVFYSGTVGGASEGFKRGASAMAISLHRDADPQLAVPVVQRLARTLIAAETRFLLNVNVGLPKSAEGIRDRDELTAIGRLLPIRVTRLGERPYMDRVEQRTDLQGRAYFWIGGPPASTQQREGEDTWAVANAECSVTPLELDITARDIDGFAAILRANEDDGE